jgi:putative transcriptional regulator
MNMVLRFAGVGLFALFVIEMALPVHAADRPSRRLIPVQEARAEDLAAGKIIIAQKDLPDPNFAETVVLITEYTDDGAAGLIINRQSKIPLSKFYPDLKGKTASDLVYSGGPVEEKLGFGLLRSRTKLENTKQLVTDVHLITDDKMLDKLVASGKDSNTLRMYVGYCGWGSEQLEREVELGAWHIFPGTAELVFDPDPDTLWSRLIRKTELRIALAVRPISAPPLFRLSLPSALSQLQR